MKRIINIEKINAIIKNMKNDIEIFETKKNNIYNDIESISIYYNGSKKDNIISDYKSKIDNLNIIIENTQMYINYLEKMMLSYQDIYETSLKNINIESIDN